MSTLPNKPLDGVIALPELLTFAHQAELMCQDHDAEATELLAELTNRIIAKNINGCNHLPRSLMTPQLMHRRKLRSFGYDQSERLVEKLNGYLKHSNDNPMAVVYADAIIDILKTRRVDLNALSLPMDSEQYYMLRDNVLLLS